MFKYLALSMLISVAQADQIVVTAFEPFGGSTTNSSQTVARAFVSSIQSLDPLVTVQLCILPVVYDLASEAALKCIDPQFGQVRAFVSFGQAGCSLQLETVAYNLDDTPSLADNAGNLRAKSPIDPQGPATSSIPFRIHKLWAGLGSYAKSVGYISQDPGRFVCNNTAYHLSREFTSRKTPYTFIHVPTDGCGVDLDRLGAELASATLSVL